jgi:hypothetical protein
MYITFPFVMLSSGVYTDVVIDEKVLSENLTMEENRLWPKMANNLSFDW